MRCSDTKLSKGHLTQEYVLYSPLYVKFKSRENQSFLVEVGRGVVPGGGQRVVPYPWGAGNVLSWSAG